MGLDPLPYEFNASDEFLERYQSLLGEWFEAFVKYSNSYITKAIRVNTLKQPVQEVLPRLDKWDVTSVPWCDEGFWIDNSRGERYDWGNLPEHQMGYVYIQKAASMIPPVVLQPQPGDTVLDMCAAPGSKTTQIAALMENEGVLVANDVDGDRLKSLGINTQKCGVRNCITTKMPGETFTERSTCFDKVLVDAPCSGTGTIRTSRHVLDMWSPNLVHRMRGVQLKLLRAGFEVLQPGGTLVYSTCTLEPEENEGVVSTLLEERDNASVEPFDLDITRSEPVTSFDGNTYHEDVRHCLRIYPQDNDTEGFFVAKIVKQNG